VVSPQAKREIVQYLIETKNLAKDRALKLVGLQNSTFYYKSQNSRDDEPVATKLTELSQKRVRWGFRMLLVLMRREGFNDNHKRIYRIYRQSGLQIQKRARKGKLRRLKLVLPIVNRPNERWSMDFVQARFADGRVFRCFNLVDDFTHECLLILTAKSIRSKNLIETLNLLKISRGLPKEIVCDNGPEFISQIMDIWAYQNQLSLKFIQPGQPTQNAFIESFNGKFRNECLNQNWFLNLDEAQKTIEEWRLDYNQYRPHRSLKMQTPNEFAKQFKSMLIT
jgi:putative transposase